MVLARLEVQVWGHADQSDYLIAYDLFSQGKAAYVIDGAWNLERYEGLGVEVGIAILPRVSKTNLMPTPMATGRYWFIANGVDAVKLEAAARFVTFMTSAQTQEQWLTKMQRLPSSKEVLGSPAVRSDPVLAPIAEQTAFDPGRSACIGDDLRLAAAWAPISLRLWPTRLVRMKLHPRCRRKPMPASRK